MKTDDVLRLLVIESSLEDAEFLLSTLRNAGIAARPSSAQNLEELTQLVDGGKPLDMILLNPEHKELTLEMVVNEVKRLGKDLPIVVLLEEHGAEAVSACLAKGACAVSTADNTDHLVAVVTREVANLKTRRQLRFLEGALRESEKRAYALLDSSRDAIAYVHEGMHVYANSAYLQLYDYDEFEDLEGLPILDMVTSEYAGKLKEVLVGLSKGESPPDHIEVTLQLPDGKSKQALMEFAPASIDGESCTQVVLRDRSEDPELASQLRDLKTQDLVTGLRNRQYFIQAVEEARLSVGKGQGPRSILFLEIDNFKASLDQVGLAGVDLVLSDIAQLLRAELTEDDVAARFGDQSFAILTGRDLDDANALAETIRKSIEGHICEVSGRSVTLTTSLGVTSIVESSSSAQDLVSIASSTAQAAQGEGGNRVQVHDPASQVDGDEAGGVQWLAVVEDALENSRVTLVFQPIVSLHGVEQQVYEVMFRISTKDGEEVSPREFIAAIADHQLGLELDRRVIMQALEKLKDHQTTSGQDVQFFIKLLPQTMADQTLLPWLAKQMQANRLSGDSVVFELPESKLMTNLKAAKIFLKGLRQLHCKFAIEQFGSGLNSFQILQHVPADYLKIDRTFMHDLRTNEEHQAKVKELAQQAKSMDKMTVAEFVEDAQSMSILWQAGVTFVQGNFLQEPTRDMSYEFS